MTVTFKGQTMENVISFNNLRGDGPLDIVRLYTEEYDDDSCYAVEYDPEDGVIAWFTGIDIPENIEDTGILGLHFTPVCARTVRDMVRELGFDPERNLMRDEPDAIVWHKTVAVSAGQGERKLVVV